MTRPSDPSANGGGLANLTAQGGQDGKQRLTAEYAHNNGVTDAFGNPPASFDSGYAAGFQEARRSTAGNPNAFDRAGMTDYSTNQGKSYGGEVHKELTPYQGGSYDQGFVPGDLSSNPTYVSAEGVTAQRLFDHPRDPIDPETGKPSLGTAGNLALGTAGVAGGAALDRALTKRAAANATSEQMRDALRYNADKGHTEYSRYLNSRADRKLADGMARGGSEAQRAAREGARTVARESAGEAAEQGAKQAGKQAGKQGAKQAAKQGGKQAAKAAGKLAGKGATRAAAGVAGRLGARAGLMAAGAAVPGPGWALAAGVAATVALEAAFNPGFRSWVGGLVRSGGIAVDTPPEPPYTNWLPHIENDKRAEVVDAVDQTITEMNNKITGVDPSEYKMWDVTGGNEVPGLTRMLPVADHINHVAGQLNTFSENMQTLMTGSESSIMQNYAEALKPALDTIASFNADAGKPLTDAVINGATTANEAYQLLLDANQQSRETLAKSNGDWLHVIPHSSVEKNDLVTNADDIIAKISQLEGQQAEIERSVLEWVNRIAPGEIDPKFVDDMVITDGGGKDGEQPGPNPDNPWVPPIAPGAPPNIPPRSGGGGGGGPFVPTSPGVTPPSTPRGGSPFAPMPDSPGPGGPDGGGSNPFDPKDGGIFGPDDSDTRDIGGGDGTSPFDPDGGIFDSDGGIFDTGDDDTAGDTDAGTEGKDADDLFDPEGGIFDTGGGESGGLGISDGSGGVDAGGSGSVFDSGDGSGIFGGTDGAGGGSLPGGGADTGSGIFDTGSGLFDTGAGSDLGVSDGAGGGIAGGSSGGIFDDYDPDSGLGISGGDGSGVFDSDDSASTSQFDPSTTGSGSSGGLGAFGSTGFDEDGNPISRGDATGLTGGGADKFNLDSELDDLFGSGDGADGDGSAFDPDADPTETLDEKSSDPFGSTNEDYDPFGVDSGSEDGTGGDGLAGDAGTSDIAGGGGAGVPGGDGGSVFGEGGGDAGGAGGGAPGADGDGVFGDAGDGAGDAAGDGAAGEGTSPFATDGEGDMPGEGADAGEGEGGPAEGDGLFDDMYDENGELKDPETMAAAANMSPEELQQAVTVDVHGEERQFLNPETAELARKILDPSVDTSMVPFADLAEQAGITMPDTADGGINISPAEAQPGDMATVNGKDWLYVGEGQLIDPVNGEIGNVADIVGDGGFAGEGEGFFRMDVDDGKLLDQAIGGAVDGVEVPETDASTAEETPRVDVPGETTTAPLPGETGTGSSTTDVPGAPETDPSPTDVAGAADTAGDATAAPETEPATEVPEPTQTPESAPETTPGDADAAPATDGGDTRDFQRTAEAPIGMGAGQNVPDAAGDNPVATGGASAGGVEAGRGGSYSQGAQAATDTSAASAGPREAEYEGQALGGPAQTRTSGAGDVPATGDVLDPNDII